VSQAAQGPDEITVEREFSLRTMPEIADHCLIPQPEGWPDDSDRFPIVPLTVMLEVMADAALSLRPGRVVVAYEQVRALRWLPVEPPTRTLVRAVSEGPAAAGPGGAPGRGDRVRVTIEGYATGQVVLADRYPAPPAPDKAPLAGERPAPVPARELYARGWMFHGPRFAGLESIDAVADDGLKGRIRALPTRGALLDNAGQLIGHWMQVSHTIDREILPTGFRAIRLYGPEQAGAVLGCTVRIREVTGTAMRADAELRTSDGRVWCQVEGWAVRRFVSNDAMWRTRLNPGACLLAWAAPGGWTVAVERWPDTASREMIMRRYLNAAERAEYQRISPREQRLWLLGRIAVKDAVRRELWERGAGPVYPVEVAVAEAAGGGVCVRGSFQAPPVSVARSALGAPGRPVAVAVTGRARAPFSVSLDADGGVIVTEPAGTTRLPPPPEPAND
jgi:hypothetical protein